ncbi:hypothetical protein H0H81_006016 [Sphagnurus paluster]|uniref:Cytochrome P450 n=1 Tax=Sphagnurus paluster TaxID=117069 RepID=A0A9P7GLF0_9AGAR|nr:hypothetical protein H0H81_006016 [Sphagnurus paluster]
MSERVGAAIILHVAYGHNVAEGGDEYVALADQALSSLAQAVAAIYPDVQAKAQKELDSVLEGRLPRFSDKPQLPLLDNEPIENHQLLRWNPVTPMGLAHCTSEEDEYEGYRIPKGTTVLPNVWAILHDADIYPDPMTFNPWRFVDKKRNDTLGINPIPEAAFGFGRRYFTLPSYCCRVA